MKKKHLTKLNESKEIAEVLKKNLRKLKRKERSIKQRVQILGRSIVRELPM